ncbi:MAG: PaaI family thioesterase [Dehalococcoidia bacterium]|nr:PaaI family thioesterase [Dehalococcoidia bacterium]MCA9843123.1 PaaI family thioesterase [Dehalococcoidia bacterium]
MTQPATRPPFEEDLFHRYLGLTLDEIRPGFARVRLKFGETTPRGIGGSVHGGVLAAMVDIAMLRAVIADLRPDDQLAGTADLNITYMRPAHGPTVDAEATVLRKGRQLAVVEVEIFDAQRRLCAKGRVLYAFRR